MENTLEQRFDILLKECEPAFDNFTRFFLDAVETNKKEIYEIIAKKIALFKGLPPEKIGELTMLFLSEKQEDEQN